VEYFTSLVQRLACVAFSLCSSDPAPFQPVVATAPAKDLQVPVYQFGVEPMSVARNLWRRYNPLIQEINRSVTGFKVKLDSGYTIDAYDRKLADGVFDFAIMEPHRVLEAERFRYGVFVRAGYRDRIGGVFIVRTDARVRSLRDLRGKTICFGARTALASTLMPRMWLRESNFSERSADILFTGSDETALFRVWRGLADAAAVSRSSWERFVNDNPEAESALKIQWSTYQLSGPAIMAHKRVPVSDRDRIAAVLARLDQTSAGRAALISAGFKSLRPGDDSSYDDVWEFLTSYARVFGYRAPGVNQ
jgi:phosphonate transport system substrate-binding protein